MRILIVEDEPALLQSLSAACQAQGYTVNTAADGEEGVFAGSEYPVDVAIIDLGLPKLPGLDLIRRLREQGRKFPILILTARDRWQDKVEGLSAGADDYVVKPFQIEEVMARVSALLRRSGGWAQPVLRCGDIALTEGRMGRVGDRVSVRVAKPLRRPKTTFAMFENADDSRKRVEAT